MKKGEYLESIGLMTFANHQFLQGNADENYKRLAENLVEIWNENEDREVCNMEEFIEKLIARLEERIDGNKKYTSSPIGNDARNQIIGLKKAIEIVKELAAEYKQCALCYLQHPCEYQNENIELPLSEWADSNGWIPCSERLPELFETYIVTIKMKYEWEKEWEYHVDVADYTCDDGYIDGAWNTFNDWCEGQECHVIAWQPLPEPYKEETT